MLIIKSLFAVSFLIQLSVLAAPIPLIARAPSLDDAIFTRSGQNQYRPKFFDVILNPVPNELKSSTAGKPLASLTRTWSMTDHNQVLYKIPRENLVQVNH